MPINSEPASASIDFGALREQASKLLDAEEAAAAPAVAAPATTEDPDPSKVRVKAADPVAQATPVVAPSPQDLADDALVRITVDGEEQILPWSEARGKISGGLKFTKNMQDLAKQRTDLANELTSLNKLRTERAALEQFLNNEEAVTGFVKNKFPHLFQTPSGQPAAQAADYNPDEIATLGQARSIAQQQADAVTKQIGEVKNFVATSIAEANQQIADRQETARHASAINNTLTDIYSKNPVLNAIPNSQDLLRFEVSKMQPRTQEEALEAFRTVAAGMVEEVGKHFKANQKIQVVAAAKAKLESKSIEPAGGSSPQLKPTSYKNADGQVDWARVKKLAMEADF